MTKITSAIVASLLVSSAFIAGPALAKTTGDVAQVKFADLNLNSAEGVATLENRIRSAVRKVCTIEGEKSLSAQQFENECKATAEADVARQMATLRSSGRLTVAAPTKPVSASY